MTTNQHHRLSATLFQEFHTRLAQSVRQLESQGSQGSQGSQTSQGQPPSLMEDLTEIVRLTTQIGLQVCEGSENSENSEVSEGSENESSNQSCNFPWTSGSPMEGSFTLDSAIRIKEYAFRAAAMLVLIGVEAGMEENRLYQVSRDSG